jgi:hypothetical protein
MAIRFDPTTFASVFGQVLTGQMLGKMQGEEQRRQQALEAQQRQQQQLLFQQGQEDRTRDRGMAPFQALAPHLGKMDPTSQAQFLEGFSRAAGGMPPLASPGGAAPAPSVPMTVPGSGQTITMPVSMGGVGSPTSAPVPAPSAPELGATADQVRQHHLMQGAEAQAMPPPVASIFGPSPTPFFVDHPEMPTAQPFAQPPPGWQPTPAPPAAPTETAAAPEAPAPDLTIDSPVGKFTLAGVDKERATAVSKRYEAVVKALKDLPSESPLRALIAQRLPSIKHRPSTLEELESAETQLALLEAQPGLVSLGVQREGAKSAKDARKEVDADIDAFRSADPAQALPLLMNLADRMTEFEKTGGKRGVGFRLIGHQADIQKVQALVRQAEETSDPQEAARLKQRAEREAKNIQGRVVRRLTTDQENRLLDKAFTMIRLKSTEELAKEGGARGIFEKLGIAHLVDGIDGNFAGAKLEERWDKILGRVAGLAGKDPGTQKLVLGEAQRIARLLGKKVKLPAKVWKKLNELEKSRLTRSKQLIEIEGDKQERADAMLEFARNRDKRAGERHTQAMAKLKKGGSDVKPATELYRRWRAAEKGVDDLTSMFGVTEDEQSWEDAGLESHEMDELREAVALRDSSGADYDSYLTSKGIKNTDPMQQQPTKAAPTAAPQAAPASAIPAENRGAAASRAVNRPTTQAAPTQQKLPYSNYLEGFRYWKQRYPTASDQYINNYLAKQGLRKKR